MRTIITVTAMVETRELEERDFGVVCAPCPGILDDQHLSDPMASAMAIMALQSFLREAIAGMTITDSIVIKMGNQTIACNLDSC